MKNYKKSTANSRTNQLQKLYTEGVDCYRREEYALAKKSLIKFIEFQPENIHVLTILGSIATQQECYEEASGYFSKVVLLDSTQPAHFHNLGHSLQHLKKLEEAIVCYDQALALNPNFLNSLSNKAAIYLKQYKLHEALDCYHKVIELDQTRLEDYNNYAMVLLELNMAEEALEVCGISEKLGASKRNVYLNKGFFLGRLRRDQEAEISYLKCLEIYPEESRARWNLSHLYLRNGLYSKGWPLYEARWENKQTEMQRRSFLQPLWLGAESLEGKSIYLYHEQGLGDTIQFCRYTKNLEILGAKVILDVRPPLKKLLAGLDGVHCLVSFGEVIPAFDYHCPLMSLPLALGMDENNLTLPTPYIKAPQEKINEWSVKIPRNSRLKVGLVWSGGDHAEHLSQRAINKRRNLDIEYLNLFKGLEIDFYSLQKGDPAEGELKIRQGNNLDFLHIINYADDLEDFTDTAGLIHHLDLVISVDTSTAHLAGAMGKPVWLLNRFDSCWRWGVEGTSTHWYSQMKIFRQPKPYDWDSVMSDVLINLKSLN